MRENPPAPVCDRGKVEIKEEQQKAFLWQKGNCSVSLHAMIIPGTGFGGLLDFGSQKRQIY